MKTILRTAAMAAALLPAALSLTGCQKLQARDQLNKGVQAYKAMKYEQAIEHFKNAVNLDPNLSVARLYLATAYANSYVPGVDSPENNEAADQAVDSFKKALEQNPDKATKVNGLKGIASIYYNEGSTLMTEKKLDEGVKFLDQSKEYQQKVIQEQPDDAEAHYSIGVIDWTEAYRNDKEAHSNTGTSDQDPIKDKKVCASVQQKNQDLVQQGIDQLTQATNDRKDYDDAMAYINLLYRQKADIDCGNAAERAADLKTADGWVEQAMAAKKEKAEKQQSAGGIVLDQNANPNQNQNQNPPSNNPQK